MNMLKSYPGHPSVRSIRYALLSFAAICLFACLQVTMPVSASETGIKGKILWGPVRPGPANIGQSSEAPLRATFIVMNSKQKVASFESDDDGNFTLLLPAGNYTIVPDKSKPALFPGEQKKMVTVPEDGFAIVTLRYDTGMR